MSELLRAPCSDLRSKSAKEQLDSFIYNSPDKHSRLSIEAEPFSVAKPKNEFY
jgi:hypothetical protein